MMCTLFTPLRAASAPSRSSAACRRRGAVGDHGVDLVRRHAGDQVAALSSTPGVLVSSTSFSAFRTSAILPATTSALML